MFVAKPYNFRIFYCFAVLLIITRCHASHKHHVSKRKASNNFASCTINIWNTRDMKADKLPSIIAVVKARPDHDPKEPDYFLPRFKTGDQFLQIEFKHAEKLLIICHSEKTNYAETSIECSNGVKVPSIEVIDECKTSEPKPSLENTGKSCGDGVNNKLYEIGYKVYPEYKIEQHMYGDSKRMRHEFFSFIEVCMNPERRITTYTSHKIDGKVIAARQITSSIPNEFDMDGFKVIDKIFAKDSEKNHLKKKYNPQKQFHYLHKFFKDKLRDYFDNEESNFVARQLTPDYDMLLKNYKTLTHYYINTAPQWRILACTWDALEELIRERASRRGYELKIYTGTYDSLTLDGISVTLPEGLPVPKYFWKVVVHKRENDYAAIGFVTSNNPYDNERKPFCKNICRDNGWPIDVKTPGLGKTVCCKVKYILPKMGIKIPIEEVGSESDTTIDLSKIKEVLVIPG